MILNIDTHSGVPIYRQVMDQIRQQVVIGQLREGEQLEHVRTLAARLKVNPMTISKAYGLLEREGVLERKRGIGLFVAKMSVSEKKKIKSGILEKSMKQTASLAVQMDISEQEAADIFKEFYRRYRSGKGESDNE